MPAAWTDAATLPLWPNGPPGGGYNAPPPPKDGQAYYVRAVQKPYLRVFLPAKPNGAALMVVPGGAYDFVSIANEGLAIAEEFTARGYAVFVLIYRLPGEGWSKRWDVPLQDAQRAMRTIRTQAASYQVDSNNISVLGFSAGGHLAATLATDYGQAVYAPADIIDQASAKPAAVGLIYPVIAAEPPFTHPLSAQRLLGEAPEPETVARRSPARRVTVATPPTFIVHALDDPAVLPENALEMFAALRRIGRPVEAHFTQEGGHGFGLSQPGVPSGQWPVLFDLWLRRSMRLPPPE